MHGFDVNPFTHASIQNLPELLQYRGNIMRLSQFGGKNRVSPYFSLNFETNRANKMPPQARCFRGICRYGGSDPSTGRHWEKTG